MLNKICNLTKGFPTLITSIGFLTSGDSVVVMMVEALAEALPIDTTFVRLFSHAVTSLVLAKL